MIDQSNIDIIIELIGGSDGLALKLALKSLKQKSFYNCKALISKHGTKLSGYLINTILNLVLSGVGGIPLWKLYKIVWLWKNQRIYGILNWTCNYV